MKVNKVNKEKHAFWYEQRRWLFFWFIVFSPIALYGLWKNSNVKLSRKSFASLLYSFFLYYIVLIAVELANTEPKYVAERIIQLAKTPVTALSKEQKEKEQQLKLENQALTPQLRLAITLLDKPIILDSLTKSRKAIRKQLKMFDSCAYLVRKVKVGSSKENIQLARTLSNKLKQSQWLLLPSLRNSYGDILDNKLGNPEIDVVVGGSSNKQIRFYGRTMVNSETRMALYDSIETDLKLLRFSEVRFRWSFENSDYYGYELHSLNDGDLTMLPDH